MPADFVTRWNDFRGGDYGLEDPSRSQENQYAASNLMLYDSELIGVRPGLKPFPVNGLPTHAIVPGPNGFDVWGRNLVIVVGTKLMRIPIPTDGSTPTAVELHDYGFTPTGFAQFSQAEGNLYHTVDGRLFKTDTGDVTTEITLPAGVKLAGLVRWNYRLVGWDTEVPWRMHYSDVTEAGPQWDTWNLNGFLQVGGNEAITCLIPWYNQLLVGKKSGWHQVSGAVAERPYVRQTSHGNGPKDPRAVSQTTDNRALMWATEPVPIWYNGERPYMDRKFRLSGFETTYPTHAVVASPTGRKMFMLGEDQADFDTDDAATGMLMYRNNDWSVHDFPIPVSGLVPGDIRHGYELPEHVIFGVQRPRTIGDAVQIFSYHHNINRPGRHDDEWTDASDMGAGPHIVGSYESPAYYDAQSRMVQVRNIVIQFRKWACGGTGTECVNELHVGVRPLGKWEAGRGAVTTQTWVEPASRAEDTGTDDSWRLGVGMQGYANGFQIVIPKMKGVAIRTIEAHVYTGGRRQ